MLAAIPDPASTARVILAAGLSVTAPEQAGYRAPQVDGRVAAAGEGDAEGWRSRCHDLEGVAVETRCVWRARN